MSSKPSFPILALDTASRRVCVALITRPGEATVRDSDEEASLSLYPMIASVLAEKDLKLRDLKTIAFCEGPGSMLGIRTTVMGIRSWVGAELLGNVAICSYTSLRLGSKLITQNERPSRPFLVVTDARRKSWHCLRVEADDPGEISLLKNDALESSPDTIYSFHEFPSWTPTQAPINRLSYLPERIFSEPEFPELLRVNPEAEPMNARTLEFVKWIPQARTSDQLPQ